MPKQGSGQSLPGLGINSYRALLDGRGFAFIDPHGDAVELLMSKVPEDRIDDVIYFDPADIEHPMGMNMFEFSTHIVRDQGVRPWPSQPRDR